MGVRAQRNPKRLYPSGYTPKKGSISTRHPAKTRSQPTAKLIDRAQHGLRVAQVVPEGTGAS